MSYTLKMFNTGQITLPKRRRSKFNTENFLAEEKNWALIITPILSSEENIVYYEDKDWFWLHFPDWIDPKQLISDIEKSLDDH